MAQRAVNVEEERILLNLLLVVKGWRRQENPGDVAPLFMRFFVSFPQVFEALQAEKVGAGVSSENGARARGCELGWRPTDRAAFPCACAHLPLQPFPHFLGLDPCARPTERSVRARALLPLPSPPTAPEAAGGATCVRFSLAGIASFLPGFWGSGKVTVTCSKEHWVG